MLFLWHWVIYVVRGYRSWTKQGISPSHDSLPKIYWTPYSKHTWGAVLLSKVRFSWPQSLPYWQHSHVSVPYNQLNSPPVTLPTWWTRSRNPRRPRYLRNRSQRYSSSQRPRSVHLFNMPILCIMDFFFTAIQRKHRSTENYKVENWDVSCLKPILIRSSSLDTSWLSHMQPDVSLKFWPYGLSIVLKRTCL